MHDHPLRVEELLHAQAVAGGTGTDRVVEGEQPRLELLQAVAADRAGHAVGEQQLLLLCGGRIVHEGPVHEGNARHAVTEVERRFERFRQPLGEVLAHLEAVDDNLDGVLAFQVELGRIVQLDHLAVDARPHESLAAQVAEQVGVLALAFGDHRGEQQEGRALRKLEHLVDHLADGLGGQLLAMVGTTWNAGARVQQAQVIVDLGDRSDGRAGVVRGRFLLDRDGRRQPLDAVDIGLVHHREELAGIGGQRFDVTALPFGVDGVEGQRGLARARQPREHDQPVARQIEIEVPEVVRACAADANHRELVTIRRRCGPGQSPKQPRSRPLLACVAGQ